MAAWRRHEGARLAQALGFTHAPPWAATRHTIVRRGPRDECAAHLGAWAARVVGRLPAAPETPAVALALDGQTLRGATPPGAPGPHRFSALAPPVGVTLAHHTVDDTTTAITAGRPAGARWSWQVAWSRWPRA